MICYGQNQNRRTKQSTTHRIRERLSDRFKPCLSPALSDDTLEKRAADSPRDSRAVGLLRSGRQQLAQALGVESQRGAENKAGQGSKADSGYRKGLTANHS